MSEVIPIRPVVEVRETFIPSERLRDALVDYFLNPSLDSKTKESLRAAFLFKSWRRRVMKKERYAKDRNGLVRSAAADFSTLFLRHILLDGVAVNDEYNRLSVRARPDSEDMLRASEILTSIPTSEYRDETPAEIDIQSRLFYVKFAINNLASVGNIAGAVDRLRANVVDPDYGHKYSLSPNRLVVRNTIASLRPDANT